MLRRNRFQSRPHSLMALDDIVGELFNGFALRFFRCDFAELDFRQGAHSGRPDEIAVDDPARPERPDIDSAASIGRLAGCVPPAR